MFLNASSRMALLPLSAAYHVSNKAVFQSHRSFLSQFQFFLLSLLDDLSKGIFDAVLQVKR